MSHAPNPRAVIGDNSHLAEAVAQAYVSSWSSTLRRIAALYNTAAAHKRDAAERLRDITRNEVQNAPDYFQGLEDARKGAIEKRRERLRKREDYRQAEADKQDAAAREREAVKAAKVAGLDPAAMKYALKLGKLDVVERKEHFDAVDIYAKELGLWTDPNE